MTLKDIDAAIDKIAIEILELGLHQYGGYKKDDDNCIEIATAKLKQLIIEARIDELDKFAGRHTGDTNPGGGSWCRDVNGKQFRACVRCEADDRIKSLRAALEKLGER